MKSIEAIHKRYGSEAIQQLGDSYAKQRFIYAIPTGSLALDLALGIGGVPRGRITEIYGPESSGKTTLCQHIIAECQAVGGKAAFIDLENALDPYYAEQCGVDVENLYISQPDNAEQALDIVEMLLDDFDVVVIDSVAGLVARAEVEGEIGDAHMALIARLMSQTLRKIKKQVGTGNCAVIFTNQLRQKIGVMFGSPETTTGGKALQYYASCRIDLRRTTTKYTDKETGEVSGNRVKATIKKNKVAPPFRVAEFDILYAEGISLSGEIADQSVELGYVKKSGAWFNLSEELQLIYDGPEKFQGRENFRQALKDDPNLMMVVENRVRQFYGLPIYEESK